MKKVHVAIAAAGLAVIAAGGGWGWRGHQRAQIFSASLPPEPPLTGQPDELVQRVKTAEVLVRQGSDKAALAELGQLYQANGFLGESVICYRGLMRLEPKEPRWPHRLACIYSGFGENEAALVLWRRVLRLTADYIPARIRVGDAELKLNRPQEAAVAYDAVLEQDPRNPYALVGLARIDLAAGRKASAQSRLEVAAEKSGDRIGSDLLATIYEEQGERSRADALRAQAKAAGTYYDPPDPWMDEIFDDCYDVYRLTIQAGFADHAGDAQTARRLIDKAIALAPNYSPARYQRGMFALTKRNYDLARQDFTVCTQSTPKYADGWVRLIEIANAVGDDGAAQRALTSGLQQCPTSPTLHTERGVRHAAAGDQEAAIAEFKRAIELQPDYTAASLKLAQVYLDRNQIAEGVKALLQVMAMEPDHPTALSTLALCAIRSGDAPGATEWMRRVGLQVRVPRETVEVLKREYRARFGRDPQ